MIDFIKDKKTIIVGVIVVGFILWGICGNSSDAAEEVPVETPVEETE